MVKATLGIRALSQGESHFSLDILPDLFGSPYAVLMLQTGSFCQSDDFQRC